MLISKVLRDRGQPALHDDGGSTICMKSLQLFGVLARSSIYLHKRFISHFEIMLYIKDLLTYFSSFIHLYP